ncbi:MAG TPA: beta-eliminating lyase-related protein [Solirubrobacteraceae bacterium]
MNPRGFASDNYAGAHPEVLAALAAANHDHAPAYGEDEHTAAAHAALRAQLGAQAEPFLVFNGTGANNVCLASLCRPWEAVICAQSAHLNVDESTAPETVGGYKLQPIATPDGKLTPELVQQRIVRVGDEHYAQPRVVSITQSTELGTVYALEEIAALAELAHAHDLYLHVDGARVFNGAAACDATLAEMLAGVDAASIGGTKIGAFGVEAAVFLRPGLGEHTKYVRKQLMQLSSKQRFLAVQMSALLTDDLALRAARHANAMAARLAAGVRDVVQLTNEPQANAVFAILEPAVTARLQRDWRFYVWDEQTGEVRWMTSWDTTEDDVDRFAAAIHDAAAAGT